MQPLPHTRLVPFLEPKPKHVMPEPQSISCGSIAQGMPVLSTNRMPVRTARSSMRGLPPLGLDGSSGSSGSTTSHSSSVTSFLAMSSPYPPPGFVRRINTTVVIHTVARLCACNGNAWPRPDDHDAIPTSRALLPSAALVGSEPTATGACALRRPSVRRESSLSLEGQQTAAAAAAAAAAAVGTLHFQSPLLL